MINSAVASNTRLLAVVAVVVLAIVYGMMPRPVLVDIAAVTRGPLRVTVQEEGKTRVIERYVVSAPVAGYARRIELDVGDAIKPKQVLLSLDPLRSEVLDRRSRAEAKARVAAAQASVKAAEETSAASAADARYWEAELARVRELHENGIVSKETLDQAEADQRRTAASLRSSKFNVQVTRYDLAAARTALRYSAAEGAAPPAETVAIRPPINGSVLKIFHESEGAVNAGEPLLEIGNPRALEVEVEVLSSDAVRISRGTRVLFERWGGGDPLEGRVRLIEPVAFTKISALGVEEQRVLVIADIVAPLESWERLGDGYRVEARFILWEGEDVQQIPSSALFRRGDGWAVFTADGDRTQLRSVEVGHRSGLRAEILNGLTEGETVITHPDETIQDGTRIERRGGTETPGEL